MKRFGILISLTLVTIGCEQKGIDVQKDIGSAPVPAGIINAGLAEATNRFGFNLFSELRGADSAASTLVSPASVAMALSMTYNGACGQTQAAMAKTMEVAGFSSDSLNAAHLALRGILMDPNSDITLSIANSLWARQDLTFDTSFLATNRTFFEAEVAHLDFDSPDAPATINYWVNDQTRGKIPEIIQRIDRGAILFLINAIYLKGTWTYEFDKNRTYDRVFHHPSGDRQRRFMLGEDDFDYLDGDDFQAVRLPYGKSQRFAMYVFLPDEGSSVASLEDRLTAAQWTEWVSRFRPHMGTLHLPRITLACTRPLNNPLIALGMGIAFGEGEPPDFSRMIRSRGVAISAVNHKTFMEINEEGTEAAAVTSVGIGVTSDAPPAQFLMTIDRPFFCAIADRQSGLILFMGTINEFE